VNFTGTAYTTSPIFGAASNYLESDVTFDPMGRPGKNKGKTKEKQRCHPRMALPQAAQGLRATGPDGGCADRRRSALSARFA
jgi:hypothetical protein